MGVWTYNDMHSYEIYPRTLHLNFVIYFAIFPYLIQLQASVPIKRHITTAHSLMC